MSKDLAKRSRSECTKAAGRLKFVDPRIELDGGLASACLRWQQCLACTPSGNSIAIMSLVLMIESMFTSSGYLGIGIELADMCTSHCARSRKYLNNLQPNMSASSPTYSCSSGGTVIINSTTPYCNVPGGCVATNAALDSRLTTTQTSAYGVLLLGTR